MEETARSVTVLLPFVEKTRKIGFLFFIVRFTVVLVAVFLCLI